MQKKKLGKTKVEIPEVGLGTWQYRDGVEPLRLGISLGANLVDTAEAYGTEGTVGKAIDGISRDSVFIATKVSPHHFHYDDVLRSAESSLKRMNIDSIDLYQLHWPNSDIPIKETMKAMEYLVKTGKIKHIGVSNFSVAEMKAAQQALASEEIVSNQVEYNLNNRTIERDILPYCESQNITVIAYSPLSRGHIFGGRGSGSKLLDEAGSKYGKTKSQVALNWLLCKSSVVVIPKSEKSAHVKDNCGASDWRLREEDVKLIGEGFR